MRRESLISFFIVFVSVLPIGGLLRSAVAEPSTHETSSRRHSVQAPEASSCHGAINSREEEELLRFVEQSNRNYFNRTITGEQRDRDLETFIRRYTNEINSTEDNLKAGVMRAIAYGESRDYATRYVIPIIVRKMAGIPPTSEERSLISGLGIRPEGIDTYLDESSEQFKPYFAALKNSGITLGADGNWDFSHAELRPNQIKQNPILNTALMIFFSPKFAQELAKEDRTEAVQAGNTVFAPPSSDDRGLVRAYTRAYYESSVQQLLTGFEREMSTYILKSREASSYGNMMTRAQGIKGPAEIDRDGAFSRGQLIFGALVRMGISPEHRRLLRETQFQVLGLDRANIRQGLEKVAKVKWAIAGALLTPIAMVAAPFLGASIGVSAAAAASTSATMALMPLAFAFGKSAVGAGIAAYHQGGNYFCHFAERLQSQGSSALIHAPFMAALPSALALAAHGTGAAAAALSLGEASAVAGTAHGALNLTAALGFLSTGAIGSTREIIDCTRTLSQAREAARNHEIERANELAARGWNECASGGIDLGFAVLSAYQLARQSRVRSNGHQFPGSSNPTQTNLTPQETQAFNRIVGKFKEKRGRPLEHLGRVMNELPTGIPAEFRPAFERLNRTMASPRPFLRWLFLLERQAALELRNTPGITGEPTNPQRFEALRSVIMRRAQAAGWSNQVLDPSDFTGPGSFRAMLREGRLFTDRNFTDVGRSGGSHTQGAHLLQLLFTSEVLNADPAIASAMANTATARPVMQQLMQYMGDTPRLNGLNWPKAEPKYSEPSLWYNLFDAGGGGALNMPENFGAIYHELPFVSSIEYWPLTGASNR